MALTQQQIDYLKSADQRFTAHVGLFPAYEPTRIAPAPAAGGTKLTPKPMPMCSPRRQLADHDQVVNLYGRDSYVRGGGYVGNANIEFALQGGSDGSVTDNGDGTATYTAPSVGSGTAVIEVTVTNAAGSKVGYAYVQYPKTTYDNIVAEIASINGSVDQHGWKLTARVRGDTAGFTIGKAIVLHVEDTWGSTTSTFGGYRYSEGVFEGYISNRSYFEDSSGESWLGIEVQSAWWYLSRMRMGETYWGRSAAASRFWLTDFAPVDAIWHYVNELTNFSQYHNCTLWFDQNSIDDFIIDAANLDVIVEDVMDRTLGITYVNRHGSLLCIPDPDVRADEYWGTPDPLYTGAQSLTPSLVMDYEIDQAPYQVNKLTLVAVDNSKLGIFAISENPTAIGEEQRIQTLICDNAARLASWAVQKRAQMNRAWQINVTVPLNHTVSLCNFVDVNFTAPGQANAPTASGRTWVRTVTYRPNMMDGGWVGQWGLVHQTEGQGEAETGAIYVYGGTGAYIGGPSASAYSGSAMIGSGSGGWGSASGGTAILIATYLITASATDNLSPIQMQSGHVYTFEVQGVIYDAVPDLTITGDAQYHTDGGVWTRRNQAQFSGALIPQPAGTRWQPTADVADTVTHKYQYKLTASGNGYMSIRWYEAGAVDDTPWANNSGYWTGRIYQH